MNHNFKSLAAEINNLLPHTKRNEWGLDNFVGKRNIKRALWIEKMRRKLETNLKSEKTNRDI